MSKKIDLKGQKFKRLTIIKDSGKRYRGHEVIWLCRCDCGNLAEVRGYYLRSEHTRSCGCLSREIISKIGKSKKGKKLPEETRKKISEANKGQVPWMKGKHHTEESKRKNSEAHKGVSRSIETRKKMSESKIGRYKAEKSYLWGKHCSKEIKKKISEGRRKWCQEHPDFLRGKNSPSWRGGISLEPYGLEFNDKLKAQIRARDSNYCQLCKIYEDGKCHDVHHRNYNKQNNKPGNLITLCRSCHSKTNTNREYWENYFYKREKHPCLK